MLVFCKSIISLILVITYDGDVHSATLAVVDRTPQLLTEFQHSCPSQTSVPSANTQI